MSDPYSQTSWPQPAVTATAPPEPAPAPSKGMAIWSLVLGAIPFPPGWLVSVGLGIAVLVRSRDGRNHGKTMAIVGMSLIAAWVLVIAAVIALIPALEAQMDAERRADPRGKIFIEDIRVGDCLADDFDDLVTLVELAPCNGPHRLETYAVFELADGRFPGQKEVDRLAEGGCGERFEDFVGLSIDKSALTFQYVTPIEEVWADDRSVACFVDDLGMTTGSLKSARR